MLALMTAVQHDYKYDSTNKANFFCFLNHACGTHSCFLKKSQAIGGLGDVMIQGFSSQNSTLL